MSEYYVEAPLVGKMTGYVEADSEKEAIERFINSAWRVDGPKLHEEEEYTKDIDFSELELYKQVNKGNICYSPIGEAFAHKEEDE